LGCLPRPPEPGVTIGAECVFFDIGDAVGCSSVGYEETVGGLPRPPECVSGGKGGMSMGLAIGDDGPRTPPRMTAVGSCSTPPKAALLGVGRRAAADSEMVANGDVGPLTQCAMPAFPTVHGGHVKARIIAIEEVVGSTAGNSACVVKGQGTDQEAEVGALPKSPEADRPSSRTGCGSGSGYTAGSGTDEHDTKFGCESDAGGCNWAGGARIEALPPLQDSVVLAVGETGLQMVMEAVDWGELIGTKVDGGEHRERWADVVGGTSIDDCSTACDDLPELCGGSDAPVHVGEDACDEKLVRAEVAEDNKAGGTNDSISGVRKGRGRKSKATKRKQARQGSEAKLKQMDDEERSFLLEKERRGLCLRLEALGASDWVLAACGGVGA
jgi:hypothetical protein